ncbi:MAG TPA: hypothetical protein HA282_04570 [Nanoarchaeota archaeon]|nr:hypothetical protein [Candidatus Pacearchaeota archaeon]HIH66458.1 hypothetical protein [Nanoarchaeota archaeon]
MRRIEDEFKRADHLLFVSLKYTKTTDVIKNIIERWKSTIDLCLETLLLRAKRTKKIKEIPSTPLARAEIVLNVYKDKIVKDTVDLYLFFRKMRDLEQIRRAEFRKGVAILVLNGKKETVIDIPQLYAWDKQFREFIEYVGSKV